MLISAHRETCVQSTSGMENGLVSTTKPVSSITSTKASTLCFRRSSAKMHPGLKMDYIGSSSMAVMGMVYMPTEKLA